MPLWLALLAQFVDVRHVEAQTSTHTADNGVTWFGLVLDPLRRAGDVPDVFRRRAVLPEAACETFSQHGFPTSAWGKSDLLADHWECFGQTTNVSDAQFFYMFRGSDASINEVRLKITLPRASDLRPSASTLLAFTNVIGGVVRLRLPPVFVNAMLAGRWSYYGATDASYSFIPEVGTPRRFNLIILLNASSPLGLRFADRGQNDAAPN